MRSVAVLVVMLACGNTPQTRVVAIASASASGVAPVTTCPSYTPHDAPSAQPDLPPMPTLSTVAIRTGDAFTVYGAIHTLNAREHDPRLDRELAITGVIVDTNLPRVDKCALHHVGHADPPGCVTAVPSFWIADETNPSLRIRAEGWASSFARVYEAWLLYRGRTRAPAHLVQDDIWIVDVPFPLPAIGAKVRVFGRYGKTFTLAAAGIDTEPDLGIITVTRVETIEPAKTPASFPQLGP